MLTVILYCRVLLVAKLDIILDIVRIVNNNKYKSMNLNIEPQDLVTNSSDNKDNSNSN